MHLNSQIYNIIKYGKPKLKGLTRRNCCTLNSNIIPVEAQNGILSMRKNVQNDFTHKIVSWYFKANKVHRRCSMILRRTIINN